MNKMANEKRLIDANALLELVQFRLPIDNQNAEVIAGCVDITRRLIENAPTVDAVEVVRCVNCRSLNMTGYDEDNAQIADPLLQSGFCEMWGKDTQLCNFCSYGERREGE